MSAGLWCSDCGFTSASAQRRAHVEQRKTGLDIYCLLTDDWLMILMLRFLPLRTPFSVLCNEKLFSTQDFQWHFCLLSGPACSHFFIPHLFFILRSFILELLLRGCFVFCSWTYEKILSSLSQRTFVPTSKCFQVVSVHGKSSGILQRMKGENSCSEIEFIQHFLSVLWQALHISCKRMCKKF